LGLSRKKRHSKRTTGVAFQLSASCFKLPGRLRR